MSIRKVLEGWKKGLGDNSLGRINRPNYGFEFMHEVWSPKFKYFQPPMWQIFRWAYDVRRRLLINSCPINNEEQ